MARLRRKSGAAAFATKRAEALVLIDPALDLGHGLDLESYRERISAVEVMNDRYNALLAELDGMLEELELRERVLLDYSTRMLAAVAARFGKSSEEYEKAGGKRRELRGRRGRVATEAAGDSAGAARRIFEVSKGETEVAGKSQRAT